MRFSIKNSREELEEYFLLFGFIYNDKNVIKYYSYNEDRDDLTLIVFINNRKDAPVFNLAIYKYNIRVASYYEDEAFDFLNDFFESERRKLTISNMLKNE